ncbi:hypothetical protein T484DRAFT_3631930 [Baffinella frigidus]|nr:hypothetical protein T484DRAFT_3631930 [Cryptophyta sp. CCMP2293]
MDSGDFHIRVDDEIENNNATAFLKQINSDPYVVVALGHGRPFYGGLDDWDRASLTQYNPPENMTEMVPLNIRKMTNAYGDTPYARKENADLMSHRAVVAMKRLRLVARQVMKDVWKPQQTEEQFSVLMHQRWQVNGYDMQQGDEPSMTIEREVSDRPQGNSKRTSTGRIDMVVTIGQVLGEGPSLLGGGMTVTKRYVVIAELKYYRTPMELFGKKNSKEVVCSTAASMVGEQIKGYMLHKSAIGEDMCYVPVAAMLIYRKPAVVNNVNNQVFCFYWGGLRVIHRAWSRGLNVTSQDVRRCGFSKELQGSTADELSWKWNSADALGNFQSASQVIQAKNEAYREAARQQVSQAALAYHLAKVLDERIRDGRSRDTANGYYTSDDADEDGPRSMSPEVMAAFTAQRRAVQVADDAEKGVVDPALIAQGRARQNATYDARSMAEQKRVSLDPGLRQAAARLDADADDTHGSDREAGGRDANDGDSDDWVPVYTRPRDDFVSHAPDRLRRPVRRRSGDDNGAKSNYNNNDNAIGDNPERRASTRLRMQGARGGASASPVRERNASRDKRQSAPGVLPPKRDARVPLKKARAPPAAAGEDAYVGASELAHCGDADVSGYDTREINDRFASHPHRDASLYITRAPRSISKAAWHGLDPAELKGELPRQARLMYDPGKAWTMCNEDLPTADNLRSLTVEKISKGTDLNHRWVAIKYNLDMYADRWVLGRIVEVDSDNEFPRLKITHPGHLHGPYSAGIVSATFTTRDASTLDSTRSKILPTADGCFSVTIRNEYPRTEASWECGMYIFNAFAMHYRDTFQLAVATTRGIEAVRVAEYLRQQRVIENTDIDNLAAMFDPDVELPIAKDRDDAIRTLNETRAELHQCNALIVTMKESEHSNKTKLSLESNKLQRYEGICQHQTEAIAKFSDRLRNYMELLERERANTQGTGQTVRVLESEVSSMKQQSVVLVRNLAAAEATLLSTSGSHDRILDALCNTQSHLKSMTSMKEKLEESMRQVRISNLLQVDGLQEDRRSAQSEHDGELLRLKDDHSRQLQLVDAGRKDIEKRLRDRIDDLEVRQIQVLRELEGKHAEEMQMLNALGTKQLGDAGDSTKHITEALRVQISTFKGNHSTEVRQLEQDFADKVAILKKHHIEQLDEVDSEKANLENLTQERLKQLHDAHAEHLRLFERNQRDSLHRDTHAHDEKVRLLTEAHEEKFRQFAKSHEEELRKLNVAHREKVQRVREENAKRQPEHGDRAMELEALKVAYNTIGGDIERLQVVNHNLTRSITASQARVLEANALLEEMRASNTQLLREQTRLQALAKDIEAEAQQQTTNATAKHSAVANKLKTARETIGDLRQSVARLETRYEALKLLHDGCATNPADTTSVPPQGAGAATHREDNVVHGEHTGNGHGEPLDTHEPDAADAAGPPIPPDQPNAMNDTHSIRGLWADTLQRIREVENNMDRFYAVLTDKGRAHGVNYTYGDTAYSQMLEVFGFHTKDHTAGRLDDFAYVSTLISKIKVKSDAVVESMNTWSRKNAHRTGAVAWVVEPDSAEDLILLWARGVIGRYEFIAQGYMSEIARLNDSMDTSLFVDTRSMPKTFRENFPTLEIWNAKQTEMHKQVNANRGFNSDDGASSFHADTSMGEGVGARLNDDRQPTDNTSPPPKRRRVVPTSDSM